MDGHQFRGARIHRDMMLVSSVCRRALGCEWGGVLRTEYQGGAGRLAGRAKARTDAARKPTSMRARYAYRAPQRRVSYTCVLSHADRDKNCDMCLHVRQCSASAIRAR